VGQASVKSSIQKSTLLMLVVGAERWWAEARFCGFQQNQHSNSSSAPDDFTSGFCAGVRVQQGVGCVCARGHTCQVELQQEVGRSGTAGGATGKGKGVLREEAHGLPVVLFHLLPPPNSCCPSLQPSRPSKHWQASTPSITPAAQQHAPAPATVTCPSPSNRRSPGWSPKPAWAGL
jgi:hypothetical protein